MGEFPLGKGFVPVVQQASQNNAELFVYVAFSWRNAGSKVPQKIPLYHRRAGLADLSTVYLVTSCWLSQDRHA